MFRSSYQVCYSKAFRSVWHLPFPDKSCKLTFRSVKQWFAISILWELSCYIIGKRRLELCDDDGGRSRKVGEFLETRLFFVEVEESSLERHLRASVHRSTLDVRHESVECVQPRPLFLNTCRGCDEKYTSSHIFMLCSFIIALKR